MSKKNDVVGDRNCEAGIKPELAIELSVLLVSSFAARPCGSFAGVAQLVEQLICNHQVGGSNPFTGSSLSSINTMFKQRKAG